MNKNWIVFLALTLFFIPALWAQDSFDLDLNSFSPGEIGDEDEMKNPKPPKHRVLLEIKRPGPKVPSYLTESGGPMIFKLRMIEELGIGRRQSSRLFPEINDSAWVVWEDPDGCLSWVDPSCPEDETVLEFTPGLSLAGGTSAGGNLERELAMVDGEEFSVPFIFTYDFATNANTDATDIGSQTGGTSATEFRCYQPGNNSLGPSCSSNADCTSSPCTEVPVELDGYGYGADDDLLGLVILAESESGMVFDPTSYEPVYPKELRNLAGFLNTVSWELDSTKGLTVINATMVQPPRLFEPLYVWDNCVDDGSGCDCDELTPTPACPDGELLSLNGAEPIFFNNDSDPSAIEYKNSIQITVRAFVVEGLAPSTLTDMNLDGIVDEEDAKLAGYELLSGEELVTFQYYHQDEFAKGYLVDFDGNGVGPVVAPVSPGTLTPVPRLDVVFQP